jgi:hypothetical protein
MSRVKRTPGYQVDPKQFEEAEKKVEDLLQEMFGLDDEGDPNVEFILVDRQRQQRMAYRAIPYRHKLEDGKPTHEASEEEQDKRMNELLEAAEFNLSVAWRDFQTIFRIRQDDLHDRERKKRTQTGGKA